MIVRLSDISSKQPKNSKNTFFVCFWAYVGQPHDHLSWVLPMPFASINSTIPRTNPWEFHEKILRIGGAGKWGFFKAAILKFLSRPFWFFFLPHLCEKSSHFIWGIIFFCTMDGFFKILKKISSKLICTQLYMKNVWLGLCSLYTFYLFDTAWIYLLVELELKLFIVLWPDLK